MRWRRPCLNESFLTSADSGTKNYGKVGKEGISEETRVIHRKNLKIPCMENGHFPREKCMENGHFPGWDLPRKSETSPRPIPPSKVAIGIGLGDVSLFRDKSHPRKWPFSRANSNLDFSNSGWKMAIFQAWIFKIPGGNWPFSRPGFFKFRVKNGHFPGLDFSNSGCWKMAIFQAWIFQIRGRKWLFSRPGFFRVFLIKF